MRPYFASIVFIDIENLPLGGSVQNFRIRGPLVLCHGHRIVLFPLRYRMPILRVFISESLSSVLARPSLRLPHASLQAKFYSTHGDKFYMGEN